jgi:mannitol/fructose-specific phosphotransferase system IIA component (Ntr-type)
LNFILIVLLKSHQEEMQNLLFQLATVVENRSLRKHLKDSGGDEKNKKAK